MIIEYTAFGITKHVCVSRTHNVGPDNLYDVVLWIERPEDYYSLMSKELKNKRVVCVDRKDWLEAEVIRSV